MPPLPPEQSTRGHCPEVPAGRTRVERDSLGQRHVPADAYWGIHTLRALENFPVTGTAVGSYPVLVAAVAAVKQACAEANMHLGLLDKRRGQAVVEACEQLRRGEHADQFVVDMIQGGAGTSTNMNANEVIANLALERLGRKRGAYDHLHPNDHVNRSQSTNDVYPTAVKVALIQTTVALDRALTHLSASFETKGRQFARVVKMGRTELQDAVPMTLGQEFDAYAASVRRDQQRLHEALPLLLEVNLGATAIGSGITAHPAYAARVRERLEGITGLPLATAPDLFEATQGCAALVLLSAVLRGIAVKVSKICNDLRLLSSGPRAGLGEINLPARQAGSSIMPGKVNPVIPEMVNQVAFEVIGNDATVVMAAEAGQLQLNAFGPIIAYSLFKSLDHLTVACDRLAALCVDGITANEDLLRLQVESSAGLATALSPHLGYATATRIAQEALRTGRDVRQIAGELTNVPPELLAQLLRPESLTNPPALTGSV